MAGASSNRNSMPNAIEHDITCPDCGKKLKLQRKGLYGPYYRCAGWPDCDIAHSAHADGRPMGIPANSATRSARRAAHNAFDSLRIELGWSKSDGYQWLAKKMSISTTKCHIGRFNVHQCKQVMILCERQRPRPI